MSHRCCICGIGDFFMDSKTSFRKSGHVSFFTRYQRLTVWNKLAVWGAIASLVGFGLYFLPSSSSKTVKVTSFNQSGGITAGTVNIGKPDRQLTPQFIAQLSVILPKDKNLRTIRINPTNQDAETLRFSDKLKNYLLSLGYKAERFNGMIIYASQDWPADVNIMRDEDGTVKEIIVTPIQ